MHAAQRIRQLTHTLLIGAAHHEGPNPVVHQLLDGDDFARDLGVASVHDVEALVEYNLGATLEIVVFYFGMQAHPHLATAGEDVDRAVLVLADDDAVGAGRLSELFNLVAQGGDVLACLAQGVAELLVL